MAVKHTLVHMAFLPLFITHTHTASALRSSRCVLCVLAHQSKSKDKAQKKWTQRGKK